MQTQAEQEDYITVAEAAMIAEVSKNTLFDWCRANKIRNQQDVVAHRANFLVHKPSLEEFIEQRKAEKRIPPRRVALEPRSFEFLSGVELCMTPEQLQAHKFLLASQDIVPCPQGVLLRYSACQARQGAFDHHIHGSHIWDLDDEPTSMRFQPCVEFECPHYKERKKRMLKQGQTQRLYDQKAMFREARRKEKEALEAERLKQYTAAERQRANEIEIKYAKTFKKLQEQRKAKSENLSKSRMGKKHRPSLKRAAPEVIAAIWEMKDQGYSQEKIGNHLGISQASVSRLMIQNPRKANADV